MARVNKTEKNLQTIWDNLDKAYEYMERALDDLSLMVNIPDDIKNDMERFDISRIGCLKEDVETLIEKLKGECLKNEKI